MLLGRVPEPGVRDPADPAAWLVPPEPLWLPEDTEAVLEYLLEEAVLCPGCGLPRDETMDPETEGHWLARAKRCHACAAREAKARQFPGPQEAAGLFIGVERRSP